MKILTRPFGSINEVAVDAYILENSNGLKVTITNYGATITSIQVPDKDGNVEEIVCGFDTLDGYFSEAYLANAPYFGGTVGRYCSQIKDAQFILDGQEYQLAKMVGENNLHGGLVGFDKRIWEVELYNPEEAAIAMRLVSQHLEEGFPGNVEVKVTFSLTEANAIQIAYHATTDQDTPFTITNHSYFNLSGFKETVENHAVRVASEKRQVWDESGAATGENQSIAGQPDDLREPKSIGDVHAAMNDGFEHFYLFEEKGFDLAEVAEIHEETSGRSLKISTTEPGMLFYTGKYTSDELQRESGLQYGKFRGFCCETHRYPNGPNFPDSPKSILRKDETYESTTIFQFEW